MRSLIALPRLLAVAGFAAAGFAAVWIAGPSTLIATADSLAQKAGLGVKVIDIRGGREGFTPTLGALREGVSWFALDLNHVRAQAEASPWVETADARFMYPNRVRITLTPPQAAALWRDDEGSLRVVLDNGKLAPLAYSAAEVWLPLTLGPAAPQAAGALARDLRAHDTLRSRLRFARRIDGRRWDLFLDNGVMALLPAHRQARALDRLATLARTHDIFARDIERIDLRLDTRVVVRLAPGARLGAPLASSFSSASLAARSSHTAYSDRMRPRPGAVAYGARGLYGRARQGLTTLPDINYWQNGFLFTLSHDFKGWEASYFVATDHQRPYPATTGSGASEPQARARPAHLQGRAMLR